MLRQISSNAKNRDEEYIKIEIIVHKKGRTQEEIIKRIQDVILEKDYSSRHPQFSHVDIHGLAITGIEKVDGSELNELMDAAVGGAKSEIMQEWLDKGQEIMAAEFFDKHPMWFAVTMCPKCGTPCIGFPCPRCGYE